MRTRLYPLEELEDIPGTKVFTAKRSRQAYHLHKFCMSLMEADQPRGLSQGRARLPRPLPHEPKSRSRPCSTAISTRLIELGGNIYFLVKLSNTDGWSAQKAVGSMTGMTPDEYAAMMRAGGRSPDRPALQAGEQLNHGTHHRRHRHQPRAGDRRGHRPRKNAGRLLGARVRGLRMGQALDQGQHARRGDPLLQRPRLAR